MHTYFVAYWARGLSGQQVFGETVVPLHKAIGEIADLQPIKAHIVRELSGIGYDVVQPEVHLTCVQHLHSSPSGAHAP